MNWYVVVPILVLFVTLSFIKSIKPGMLAWTALWWISIYIFLAFGFTAGLPQSIITEFMFITTMSLLVYIMSDRERWRSVKDPLIDFIVNPKKATHLKITLVLLPLLVAGKSYLNTQVEILPPAFGRSVHPAPPSSVNFKGKTIDLVRGENPYRILESEKPEEFKTHLENGRKVYYQNCFYCHGDNMGGDGIYAYGLDPIPTNFQDPANLPMLQEGFLFWRISKGGIGLPEEGGPWNSAMPAWENFLSEEQIWDVILYIYDFIEQKPRALEHGHE